jgi:hypothetical protein
VIMAIGEQIHTTLLDALNGRTRYRPVYSLGRILDRLDGALARDGRGAEEAGLAGNLLAEHCVCGVDCVLVVSRVWESEDGGIWVVELAVEVS